MKLLNNNTKDILNHEVSVSMTVRELISMRAVFGDITPLDFDRFMKSGKEDEINMKELIDRIRNEESGIHMDIYDDLGDVLAEVLDK